MTEKNGKNKPGKTDTGNKRQSEKDERLARALRENLKKRRQQSGGRRESDTP